MAKNLTLRTKKICNFRKPKFEFLCAELWRTKFRARAASEKENLNFFFRFSQLSDFIDAFLRTFIQISSLKVNVFTYYIFGRFFLYIDF